MKIQSLITVLTVLQTAFLYSARADADDNRNLLQNADFEKTENWVVSEKIKRKMPNVEAYEVPELWTINPLFKKAPGKLVVMRDPENSHNGFKYISFKGKIVLMTSMLLCKPEEKYLFSVWAKGKGMLEMWVYFYNISNRQPPPPKGVPGSRKCINISSPEWNEYQWEFFIPEAKYDNRFGGKSPYIVHFRPAFHVKGDIDLDNACLIKCTEKSIKQLPTTLK